MTNFLNKKRTVSILVIWTFLHIVFLIYAKSKEREEWDYIEIKASGSGWIKSGLVDPVDRFYPLNSGTHLNNQWFDSYFYDYTELFVYVGLPWLLLFLYHYNKRD